MPFYHLMSRLSNHEVLKGGSERRPVYSEPQGIIFGKIFQSSWPPPMTRMAENTPNSCKNTWDANTYIIVQIHRPKPHREAKAAERQVVASRKSSRQSRRESGRHIHGRYAGMLRVGYSISDDVLEKDLEYTPRFLIDEATDALHATLRASLRIAGFVMH